MGKQKELRTKKDEGSREMKREKVKQGGNEDNLQQDERRGEGEMVGR